MPNAAQTLAKPLDWDALDAAKYEDEVAAVARLIADEPLKADAEPVRLDAVELVRDARRR